MGDGAPLNEQEATRGAGTIMVLGFCLGGPALLMAPEFPGMWRLILGIGGLGVCLLALSVWLLALAPFGHFGALGRWLLSHSREARSDTGAEGAAGEGSEPSDTGAEGAAADASEPETEGSPSEPEPATESASAEPTDHPTGKTP